MLMKFPELTEREFLLKYLQFINVLLPEDSKLVPSEINLIIEFTLLPEEKFSYQRFSSIAKNKVIESAEAQGWKLSKLNINNKILGLIDKSFLRRDEDGVIYMPKSLLSAFSTFKKEKTFKVEALFNGTKKD